MTQRISGTVTLEDGQTVSGIIALGPETLSAIQLPAGFSGTAITFQASIAGNTYDELRDSAGDVVTLTVTAGSCIYLDPVIVNAFAFFKLVSGTAQSGDAAIAWSAVRL